LLALQGERTLTPCVERSRAPLPVPKRTISNEQGFCRRLPAVGRLHYGVSRETKEREDRTVLVEPIKTQILNTQTAAVTRITRFLTAIYNGCS